MFPSSIPSTQLHLIILLFITPYFTTNTYSEPHEAVLSNSTLPTRRSELSAVYDSQDSIYIIGGYDPSTGLRSEIIKYSVVNDSLEIIGQLPVRRAAGAAILYTSLQGNPNITTGDVYYFGGLFNTTRGFNSDIVQISTATANNNVTIVNNLLTKTTWPTAVWDEVDNVYVIGGFDVDSDQGLDTIVKYSISSNQVQIVGQLPIGLDMSSSVWENINNNGSIYIFGGYSYMPEYNKDGASDLIIKYYPSTGVIDTLKTTLPIPLSSSCAIWNDIDSSAYIIGGYPETIGGWSYNLIRFSPTTQQLQSTLIQNFPSRIHDTSCVFVSKLNRIYVFGGWVGNGPTESIWYIQL